MNDLGVIGMGVMGLNLAMNAAEKGFQTSVYNRTTSRMTNGVAIAQQQNLVLHGFETVEGFVKSLAKPRKILMLVQAGPAVDATLNQLLEILDHDDIVIDGGNEFYSNTDRRASLAKQKGIQFFGMGVSGGEEGARNGPALMPGGSREAYAKMEPILKAIAAKSDCGACVDFMGNGSAGNYVKMVHNGIEYGDMQLIAESYALLKQLLCVGDNKKISSIFADWNQGRMSSYLIEITSTVLTTEHPDQAITKYLIDDVLDVAGAKGTGKWTAQEACEKGIACPTIQAALDARNISGMNQVRPNFASLFNAAAVDTDGAPALTIEDVECALYLSKLCSYAQGLSLIGETSRCHNYEIEIDRVARCWTGGCIIRATLLSEIMNAFKSDPKLANLLMAPAFSKCFTSDSVGRWKKCVTAALIKGIPIPAISASLNWFLMLSQQQLPLNMTQAQRDFFGAHTFMLKSDASRGPVHADWHKGQFTDAP